MYLNPASSPNRSIWQMRKDKKGFSLSVCKVTGIWRIGRSAGKNAGMVTTKSINSRVYLRKIFGRYQMDVGKIFGSILLLILIIAVLFFIVGAVLSNLISDYGLNAHNTTVQNTHTVNNSTSNHTQSGNNSSQLGMAIIISALIIMAITCVGLLFWIRIDDIAKIIR